jgi:hypothetical protein
MAVDAGSLVFPLPRPAALERTAPQPFAFTIAHAANRLAAGGTAVACLVTARLRGRFIAPRPVTERDRQKNFCCVTTHRCKFWLRRRLRRSCAAPTARPLGLGVLGLDRFILAPPGLPPRRLPAPHQPQAFRVLAITLVPAPRLVLSSTSLAQTNPQSWSSRTSAVWFMMMAAHGSLLSQGLARRECTERSLRALIENREAGSRPPVYGQNARRVKETKRTKQRRKQF